MHPRSWSVALLLALSLAVAGCVEDEAESRDDPDATDRQFTVEVPSGATQVHVDVTARALEGEPDVTVLVEDEAGGNVASDTFSVAGSSERRVSADVDGQARLVVTVRVIDGDAELDVRVSATVPAQAEPVIILQERVVIVQVEREPAPTPTPTATTPAPTAPATPSPTPAPSPTPTPTPPPTGNETNETTTNGTNETA